ncbi:MAG: DUF2330 domain-containing protein [Planctomycetales bacterium]
MIPDRRWIAVSLCLIAARLNADPCGMVPPIYQGEGAPIVRVGEQTTYVFFKNGVETFVIRPAFQGKVEEFGMLIPFPTPPALRKVSDNIFPHIANAVDPPEVVVDLSPLPPTAPPSVSSFSSNSAPDPTKGLEVHRVRVIKEEAVGMYQVVVLEAGSSAALKMWMDDHGYKYPEGMDKVCDEYVEAKWCFVAIKTKVGTKSGIDPKPAQRGVQRKLPAGSTFDGNVQAMGFRFKTDELVVPMRLSAFNEGQLRNIVYLLSDSPKKIRSIPEEYVVRQISGKQLFKNVTDPLPLRIIGGTEKDLQKRLKENGYLNIRVPQGGKIDWNLKAADRLKQARNPEPFNRNARELCASDLLAVSSGNLSLPHEEGEKELLRIGERFGLRGKEIDKLNEETLAKEREKTVEVAIKDLKEMTMTVVDGDFPREVLAAKNLTFAEYEMPARRNSPSVYDAKIKGPARNKQGVLKLGALEIEEVEEEQVATSVFPMTVFPMTPKSARNPQNRAARKSERNACFGKSS